MTDFSRGEGEYLQAYAELSQCNFAVRSIMFKVIQKNFVTIFSNETDDVVEKVYQAIEKVIKDEPILSMNCKNNA